MGQTIIQVIAEACLHVFALCPQYRLCKYISSCVISIAYSIVYAVSLVDIPFFCKSVICVISLADFKALWRFYRGQVPVGIIAIAGDCPVHRAVPLDFLCLSYHPSVLIVSITNDTADSFFNNAFFQYNVAQTVIIVAHLRPKVISYL